MPETPGGRVDEPGHIVGSQPYGLVNEITGDAFLLASTPAQAEVMLAVTGDHPWQIVTTTPPHPARKPGWRGPRKSKQDNEDGTDDSQES